MKKYIKVRQHQTLPIEPTVKLNITKDPDLRAAYVAALRMKSWTLQSIADALGLSRERIRQVENMAKPSYILHVLGLPGEFPIPELPTITVEIPDAPVYVEPKPETLARLLELQPLAQQVRYDHPQFRKEAEEYSALVWHAHSVEGVPIYRLAKRLGVTHGALRFRLVRYGYMVTPTGKSKSFHPVKTKNRIM